MKRHIIWVLVSLLLIVGLSGVFACSAPTATTPSPSTPGSTTAPSPTASYVAPTVSPTSSPSTSPTQTQVIKWRGQMVYNDLPPQSRFPGWFAGDGGSGKHFADWIKKRSGGRLEIDLAPPGSIVPAAESLTAVEQGTLDFIGHTYAGYYTGAMPEGNIEIGLPFAWETQQETWDALYRWGLQAEFEKVYAAHKVYPIIFGVGDIYGWGSTFDISTLDSIKGKKIRALGVYGDLVQALGGSPANVPGTELYMALKLGTIDGCVYGVIGLENNKLKEVLKYYVTSPNMNNIGVSFLINQDKLNALPKDIQDMIKQDAPYIMAGWANDYSTFEHRVAKVAAKDGYIKEVSWSEADAAKVRTIGIGLWDKVAALSPQCAKMVEIVKAQARDMGKIK